MKEGLLHALALCGDAREVLPRMGPDGALSKVFLHFPDPWWKKRHAKRRVIDEGFLVQLGRLLAKGGALFVQTDVEERLEAYEAQIAAHGAFEPAGDAPGSARVDDHAFVARSPREHRAIADGIPIYRVLFRRRA